MMTDYRLYYVDLGGNIIGEFIARCANDYAACVEALRVADEHGELEVWSGLR